MTISQATRINLLRKSNVVDEVQLYEGKVLPSWIELSLTELCNRSAGAKNACIFCPRIDPKFYPNQNLHMSLDLVTKITGELERISYKGSIVLCGYGEPMLHQDFMDVIRILKRETDARWRDVGPKEFRVELVTNGDHLTVAKIREMDGAGINYVVVSMYDGPEQIDKFKSMFAEAEFERYTLRDRWHLEEDRTFGLKLTNRAGVVNVGVQDPIDTTKPCHYLAYQLSIDWNGDVVLCPQDWYKRWRGGNVATQGLLEVWHSPAMHKRRMKLIAGKRTDHPCSGCNTDGTLHGANHVKEWKL